MILAPKRAFVLLALTVLLSCTVQGVHATGGVAPVEGSIVDTKDEHTALTTPSERHLGSSSSSSSSDSYGRRKKRMRRKRKMRRRQQRKMRPRRKRMMRRRRMRKRRRNGGSTSGNRAPVRWTGDSSWTQQERNGDGGMKKMMMSSGMKMKKNTMKTMKKMTTNMQKMDKLKMMKPLKMGMSVNRVANMNRNMNINIHLNVGTPRMKMMKWTGGGAKMTKTKPKMGGMKRNRKATPKKRMRLTWKELAQRKKNMQKRAKRKWTRRQRRMDQRRNGKGRQGLTDPEVYVYHLYYDADGNFEKGIDGGSAQSYEDSFGQVLNDATISSPAVRDAALGVDPKDGASVDEEEDDIFYDDDDWDNNSSSTEN